jgi:hypothetical protein
MQFESCNLKATLLGRGGSLMAANTGQGKSFVVFLVGLTVACAGVASFSSGIGKVLLLVGVVIILASLGGFLKLKPLEGKVGIRPGSMGMKLVGAVIAALGWVLTLFGMHLVDSVGGRMVFALIGIAVSLFGIIYILPAAFNKNAIWKA